MESFIFSKPFVEKNQTKSFRAYENKGGSDVDIAHHEPKHLGTSALNHHLASLSSHRSRPSSWYLLPLPQQPAPAPRSSCSFSAILPSWSAWERSWGPGVSSTMAACALKENWGWTPSWASSTWTVSSRRCWDSIHLSQGPTEPPCRPLNLTWVTQGYFSTENGSHSTLLISVMYYKIVASTLASWGAAIVVVKQSLLML